MKLGLIWYIPVLFSTPLAFDYVAHIPVLMNFAITPPLHLLHVLIKTRTLYIFIVSMMHEMVTDPRVNDHGNRVRPT